MAGNSQSGLCPTHGRPTKRSECAGCNAAYMRAYLSERRKTKPASELWKRAHSRAKKLHLPFNLVPTSIIVPALCPALGIPLIIGGKRTANSPSLDRVIPSLGYVEGNTRVICDRANRLKSNCTLEELLSRAEFGADAYRGDYRCIAAYVEREVLLALAWRNSVAKGRLQTDWRNLATLLDDICTHGLQRLNYRETLGMPTNGLPSERFGSNAADLENTDHDIFILKPGDA